jgi:hypothetical protein
MHMEVVAPLLPLPRNEVSKVISGETRHAATVARCYGGLTGLCANAEL